MKHETLKKLRWDYLLLRFQRQIHLDPTEKLLCAAIADSHLRFNDPVQVGLMV